MFEQTLNAIAYEEKKILQKTKKAKCKASKISVNELLNSYFALSHTNPVTIRQARYHACHITSVFGGRQASLLTRKDMLNFAEAQKLSGLAQSTINRRVSILRAALNWAVRNGLLTNNPLSDLRMPRARSRRIAPPTPQEAEAILVAAAPHVQRVVILGFYLGARVGASELFKLEWKSVDLENAIIWMPNAHKGDSRTERFVPVKKDILRILASWQTHDKQNGHSHVINWGGNPLRSIARAWQTALRKAGIVRRIRPYDLRHAFATYSLAANGDIGATSKNMGHTDATMILRVYQHVQTVQQRSAVEGLPNILPKAKGDRALGLPR